MALHDLYKDKKSIIYIYEDVNNLYSYYVNMLHTFLFQSKLNYMELCHLIISKLILKLSPYIAL